MQVYEGVNIQIHIFLTSALAGGEWSASRHEKGALVTHWIGGWVDPRARLDAIENRGLLPLPGIESRPFSP
jgi:hypothetical protein